MKHVRPFFYALLGLIAAKLILAFFSLGNPYDPVDFLRPVDDSYITYRYAQNLGESKGLVYNDGERVEGGTTFAMIMLLAPFAAVGISRIDIVAIVFSLLAQAGIVAIAWSFMRRRDSPPGAPEYFTAGFLTLSLTSLVWAWSGMETTLHALVWLAAVVVHLRESEKNSWPVRSALLTVLAGLFHPDGIVIAAVLGISWLVPLRKERIARGFAYGGMVIALFGGYWLWRWSYFGRPLPNTFYAKVGGSGGALLGAGWTYLRVAWFATVIPAVMVFLAVQRSFILKKWPAWARVIVVCVVAFLFVIRPNSQLFVMLAGMTVFAAWRPGDLAKWPRWVWLSLGLTGLYSIFIVRVGGDFYPFHRFFAPLLPLIALVFWKLWRDLRDEKKPAADAPRSSSKLYWKIAAVLLATNLFSYFYTLQGMIHRDLQRVVKNFAEAGTALRESMPPGSTVATLPIGAVGFFSGLRIHDMMGLVEPHIARMSLDMTRGVVGHQKYDHAYTLGTRPEAIVVLPSLYTAGDRGLTQWNLENALEPVQYRIYNEPALRRDYRLAFLPVGGNRGLYGFLRADLVDQPGYRHWAALDENAVQKAYNTPALAAKHPLHGRSFGIWSFK